MKARKMILAVLAVLCIGTVVAVPIASSASRGPVLGSKKFVGKYGKGFGTYAPHTFFNGGDPSGLVEHIHWRNWGKPTARGKGLTSIFRPEGGYYRKQGLIYLKATNLGRCSKGGRKAYRTLIVREAKKPGGSLGKPFRWSGAKSLCKSLVGR